MAEFRNSKQMVFMWCKDGLHDQCRTQYGGDRIVCSCDCDPNEHGINYKPISKTMTEEEVKSSIASLNMLMVGDAGDGKSENRAVMPTSSVWGDQVKEGNQSVTGTKAGYKSSYFYEERLDATSIEELEKRRNNRPVYVYDGFEAWL